VEVWRWIGVEQQLRVGARGKNCPEVSTCFDVKTICGEREGMEGTMKLKPRR
jgi:hypothetical protein